MKIITMTNGSAAMMAIVLMPLSASSPLAHNSSAATAPVNVPQKMVTPLLGSCAPRSDKVPITNEAASAPDTKKIATSTITSTDAMPVSGRLPSMSKS